MVIRKPYVIILLLGGIIALNSCEEDKYPQGHRVYKTYCENCHMQQGQGLGTLYPSLQNSSYLTSEVASLPCLIRHGKKSTVLSTVYMPEHKMLTDTDMHNLINYLTHKWGSADASSPNTIADALATCP